MGSTTGIIAPGVGSALSGNSLVQVRLFDPSGAGTSGIMISAKYVPGEIKSGRAFASFDALVTDIPVTAMTNSAGEALLYLNSVENIGYGYGSYQFVFTRNGVPVMETVSGIRITGDCELSSVVE